MKVILTQIIGSSVVLGLMAGAVALHFAHISGARSLGPADGWTDAASSRNPILEVAAHSPVAPASRLMDADDSRHELEVTTVATMQQILEAFRDLRDENQTLRSKMHSDTAALRNQLEESNRDLSELQFRVDSHSESFRPLRAAPDFGFRPNSAHPLLPPKR